MTLERLANELLFEIFDYLPSFELLRCFQNLNLRFERLILDHFRTHQVDFRNASKEQLECVYREFLPPVMDSIVSLQLSNDDETPQQVQLFRHCHLQFDRFTHLASLSLHKIRSCQLIVDIISECKSLKTLKLIGCFFELNEQRIRSFLETVWSLEKLIDFHLDIEQRTTLPIPIPRTISFTIERLALVGFPCRLNQLASFSECTPRLRSLTMDFYPTVNETGLNVCLPTIEKLNLVFVNCQSDWLINLLTHLPNLIALKIEGLYTEIDGNQWKEIIEQYLPKLRKFQMKMGFSVSNQRERNEIIQSFKTKFWIEQHRWEVRCYQNVDQQSNMLFLQTWPYSFSQLDLLCEVNDNCSRSDLNDSYSYKKVKSLNLPQLVSETWIHSQSQWKFPQVRHLSIRIPYNDRLKIIFEQFHPLDSLDIWRTRNISDVIAIEQVQFALNHLPSISSIHFRSWTNESNEYLLPFLLLKPRWPILKINLLGYKHWFDRDQVIDFSRSLLCSHCELLMIQVKDSFTAIELIRTMKTLRSLIIQSLDDQENSSRYQGTGMCWNILTQNLPNCSIERDERFTTRIRIWIQH